MELKIISGIFSISDATLFPDSHADALNISGILASYKTQWVDKTTNQVVGGTKTVDTFISRTNLIASGLFTCEGAQVTPAIAMTGFNVNVSKNLNTKTISNDITIGFSAVPSAKNSWFSVRISNSDDEEHIVKIPDTFSLNHQRKVTQFIVAPSGTEFVTWCYDGTGYYGHGIPVTDSVAVKLPMTKTISGVYKLVSGDQDVVIETNDSSANTITVPLNSETAFPINTEIKVYQMGAGNTRFTASQGVTINCRGNAMKFAGQYSAAVLRKNAQDSWVLAGDLTV